MLIGLLRDGLWQFVGALLALIALIAMVQIYRKQKVRKQLSYDVLSNSSIMTGAEGILGQLEIKYNGEEVSELYVIEIKLVNNGNIAIKAEDIASNIAISVEEGKVLSSEVTYVKPKDLVVKIESVETNKVILAPTLINAGDEFVIKLLVDDMFGEVQVGARIADVRSIERIKGKSTVVLGLGMSVGALIFTIIGVIASQIIEISNMDYLGTMGLALALVFTVLMIIITLISFSQSIESNKSKHS